MPQRTAFFIVLTATALPGFGADRPARYVAAFTDGQRVEASRLRDWHDEQATPRLDGQVLFSPANSTRWLRDRWQSLPELPAAYVEFTNGDRLPGEVTDYRSGQEDLFDPAPPHLIVRVALEFEPPENKPVAEIRVATEFVRRIVWQRREGQAYQAGTAFYRDGRSLAFRSLRLHQGEAHVLTAEADQHLDWGELAELHLDASDAWDAYFDQLALLCPTRETRLLDMETASGLVAMASTARFAARFEGNSSDPDRWVHGVQPAWSLDILWVPFREILCYRFFLPHEMPLSRMMPRQFKRSGGAAEPSSPELNRNASGGTPRSKTREFGWGFGVRGAAERVFELASFVRSFQASVCLDRDAGEGGCVRPRIFVRTAGSSSVGDPLWEGPVLVGSEAVAETGVLRLPENAAVPCEIVLQIDAVSTNRPPGADPFEIRDFANWCDPLVTLDIARVEEELTKRLAAHFVAWRNWDVDVANGSSGKRTWQVSYHRAEGIPGSFEPALRTTDSEIALTAERAIARSHRWLVIAASQPPDERDEAKIAVQFGEGIPTVLTVPRWQGGAAPVRPLAVEIPPAVSSEPKNRRIVIRQLAAVGRSAVAYDLIALVDQLPARYDVLQTARDAAASLPKEHESLGELRLSPASRLRVPLPNSVRVRSNPKLGEARFLRLAIRKQGGGRVAVDFEDAQAHEQSARYDLGQGPASFGAATRIWEDGLPENTIVVTRDLFADFGSIDLVAITLHCVDGGEVFFEQVELGTVRTDFDEPPSRKSPSAR